MRLTQLDRLRQQERELLYLLENEEETKDRLEMNKQTYILQARSATIAKIIRLRDILRACRAEIAEEEMKARLESFHAEKRDSILRRIGKVFGIDQQPEKADERGDARTDRARASAEGGVQPDPAGGREHPRGDEGSEVRHAQEKLEAGDTGGSDGAAGNAGDADAIPGSE